MFELEGRRGRVEDTLRDRCTVGAMSQNEALCKSAGAGLSRQSTPSGPKTFRVADIAANGRFPKRQRSSVSTNRSVALSYLSRAKEATLTTLV